jgi:hypothetical protein|tara:strand:+ start:20898 stop:21119 length:222 start_codon:yes stop_codon:yes gene_type:complete
MAEFKLIAVKQTNTLLDTNSNSVDFTITYEKKAWYYFGKIKVVKSRVSCPDFKVVSWLRSMQIKIEAGEWRKN